MPEVQLAGCSEADNRRRWIIGAATFRGEVFAAGTGVSDESSELITPAGLAGLDFSSVKAAVGSLAEPDPRPAALDLVPVSAMANNWIWDCNPSSHQ